MSPVRGPVVCGGADAARLDVGAAKDGAERAQRGTSERPRGSADRAREENLAIQRPRMLGSGDLLTTTSGAGARRGDPPAKPAYPQPRLPGRPPIHTLVHTDRQCAVPVSGPGISFRPASGIALARTNLAHPRRSANAGPHAASAAPQISPRRPFRGGDYELEPRTGRQTSGGDLTPRLISGDHRHFLWRSIALRAAQPCEPCRARRCSPSWRRGEKSLCPPAKTPVQYFAPRTASSSASAPSRPSRA